MLVVIKEDNQIICNSYFLKKIKKKWSSVIIKSDQERLSKIDQKISKTGELFIIFNIWTTKHSNEIL